MQQLEARQRGKASSLRTSGLWRCLALVLVLALSMSGLIHATMDDHTASAASRSHEIAPLSEDNGGEPCCLEHNEEAPSTICSIAGGCPFCVPLLPALDTSPQADSESFAARAEAGHFNRAPAPHFRPPEFFTNV